MARRLIPLLLTTILSGCLGTEVGNPDEDSGGPKPEPIPSDLRALPAALTLESSCPGGTRRASLLLSNQTPFDVDAVAGGTRGEEAHPSSFEVDGYGTQELVAVIHLPENGVLSAEGKLVVDHRREGVRPGGENDRRLEIPWSAPLGPRRPEATVLCGEAMPCALLSFGNVFTGAVWQMPLEVANDGCAPLRLERIVAEGDEVEIAGPALPLTLQAGERWQGRLLLRPAATGFRSGKVVVETDDDARPQQSIGWSAAVSG